MTASQIGDIVHAAAVVFGAFSALCTVIGAAFPTSRIGKTCRVIGMDLRVLIAKEPVVEAIASLAAKEPVIEKDGPAAVKTPIDPT